MIGHDDLRPLAREEAKIDAYLMPIAIIVFSLILAAIIMLVPGVLIW